MSTGRKTHRRDAVDGHADMGPLGGETLGHHSQTAFAGIVRRLLLRVHGDDTRDRADKEDLFAEVHVLQAADVSALATAQAHGQVEP